MIDHVALLISDRFLDADLLLAQADKPDLVPDMGSGLIQGSLKIQTPMRRHRSGFAP